MAEEKQWYPISLSIDGMCVVVVGGGNVAERKILGVLSCGARVTVVSPMLTDGIKSLVAEGTVGYREKEYAPEDIAGAYLVFAVTNDRAVNARVADDARSAGVLVNVCDSRDTSSFIVPAVARKGVVSVAVSTGGQSPAEAVMIRDRMKEYL